MQQILPLLFIMFMAVPCVAAQRPELPATPPADEAMLTTRTATVASLGREAELYRSLGLTDSETFAAEENPAHLVDEIELSFPQIELPESDIPLTLNGKVEYFVNYFRTRGRSFFARWLSRSERYIPLMKEVLRKEKLPEDLVYLAMIESGFTPHAVSVASAVGPWQFMSGTGKRYSLRIDPWIDERRDPLKSSIAAALYLKELYALFNNNWYLAAAGYNAGENKILRAIDKYNSRDFWELTKGSYLKRETKDYVPKLLAAAIIAKEPARYGFADVAYLPPLELDTVTIPSRTDLELVARITDVPYPVLKELNPELRRWCTPPDYANYQLRLPKGKKGLFEAEYAKIPENKRYSERIVYTRYRPKKRETLAAVARRFNTSVESLAEANHLKSTARLRGKTILVPVTVEKSPDKPAEQAPLLAAAAVNTVAKADPQETKRFYTVKKGDTLASLARRFNVSARILAAWNNIRERVALRPGKRLIVAKYVDKDALPGSSEEKS
ncbi:lytic transglycosylase domain-containing protein [Geobacter argillaceus]|uniref:Membrane-bound lytic murein transglycosylase D n=1 Tax=Geobacter argillaceus TaxID=345631 RepID=A0A562V654_9BACT|nr:lytic transglycosylase domain-containing protein [Geobacter argillaceus]TWJ13389.1 membrane-bound lytic murein transglycosylase D [Geobacter argillaceus]